MSVWVTVGFVGFGLSRGLFPEVRLGVVCVGWCRGAIGQRARTAWHSTRKALEMLRGA